MITRYTIIQEPIIKQLMPFPAFQSLILPSLSCFQCHAWPSWMNFEFSLITIQTMFIAAMTLSLIPPNTLGSSLLTISFYTTIASGCQKMPQLFPLSSLNFMLPPLGATPVSPRPLLVFLRIFIGPAFAMMLLLLWSIALIASPPNMRQRSLLVSYAHFQYSSSMGGPIIGFYCWPTRV